LGSEKRKSSQSARASTELDLGALEVDVAPPQPRISDQAHPRGERDDEETLELVAGDRVVRGDGAAPRDVAISWRATRGPSTSEAMLRGTRPQRSACESRAVDDRVNVMHGRRREAAGELRRVEALQLLRTETREGNTPELGDDV